MTWDVTVAGTLHRNTITTPFGTEMVYGGSAVYFALAAAPLAPVHLHGIVGQDAHDAVLQILAGLPVDTGGLATSLLPTHHWYAVHDFERWVTASERVEPGCDASWEAGLTDAGKQAQVLFLGSMEPRLQLRILQQTSARLIGSDSMTHFAQGNRNDVMEVATGSDVLFLNRAELAALTQSSPQEWPAAAKSLCGLGRLRCVVVKAGPEGAACVTASGIAEFAPAPVEVVVDPTGAGDAVAGGFLGACAQQQRDDESFFAVALERGLQSAAAAISSFGTAALRQAALAAAAPLPVLRSTG